MYIYEMSRYRTTTSQARHFHAHCLPALFRTFLKNEFRLKGCSTLTSICHDYKDISMHGINQANVDYINQRITLLRQNQLILVNSSLSFINMYKVHSFHNFRINWQTRERTKLNGLSLLHNTCIPGFRLEREVLCYTRKPGCSYHEDKPVPDSETKTKGRFLLHNKILLVGTGVLPALSFVLGHFRWAFMYGSKCFEPHAAMPDSIMWPNCSL